LRSRRRPKNCREAFCVAIPRLVFDSPVREDRGWKGDRPHGRFQSYRGGGPDKDESKRQQAREWAEHEFSWTIREVAANTLRIIRGAGKPDELLLQMKRTIDAAVKFQEAHDFWPQNLIANELQIQSRVENFHDGLREGRYTQATINPWSEDGTFEKMDAEYIIQCGALQTIASDLVGQLTQKRAGEREFHDGIRGWIQNREEQARKQEKERKANRAAQSARKPRKKDHGPFVL